MLNKHTLSKYRRSINILLCVLKGIHNTTILNPFGVRLSIIVRHMLRQAPKLVVKPHLSPVYTDMRFLHALTHAISDLNEVQYQIGSV